MRHCGDLKTPLPRILSKSFSTFALALPFASPSLPPSLLLSLLSVPLLSCSFCLFVQLFSFFVSPSRHSRDAGLKNFRRAKDFLDREESTLVVTYTDTDTRVRAFIFHRNVIEATSDLRSRAESRQECSLSVAHAEDESRDSAMASRLSHRYDEPYRILISFNSMRVHRHCATAAALATQPCGCRRHGYLHAGSANCAIAISPSCEIALLKFCLIVCQLVVALLVCLYLFVTSLTRYFSLGGFRAFVAPEKSEMRQRIRNLFKDTRYF